MRLGIDFGTTRTVVAAADRGNYPVVSFQDESGNMQPWYPSLIGSCGDHTAFGMQAQARLGEPGWAFLRSLKRSLGNAAPDATVRLGDREAPVLRLLADYLAQLHRDLREKSNLEVKARAPLEILIAVPANANSNQRFLTMEAFRQAGFQVLGMIHEPSAAGIEFAHHHAANEWAARKEHLFVYDLGGGTFDASVISRKESTHEVLTDEGIAQLGGDDFDALLLDMALERGAPGVPLSDDARFQLLEECRRQKESLHPNTRRIALDLGRTVDGAGSVVITTDEFYDRCRPLVESTLASVEAAMVRARLREGITWNEVAVLYLVGGSADLPIVGRMLRETYGRRVRRSPYPHSATAIGLAIAADAQSGFSLRERFTRYFGVWREADDGARIVFDTIFAKDTRLPQPSEAPLEQTRCYSPAHNLARFRYLECGALTEEGHPAGEITPWDDVVFPMDPGLRELPSALTLPVCRTEHVRSRVIEERYRCDARGTIEVTITDQNSGYRQEFRLRRPTLKQRPRAGSRRSE